MWFYVAVSLLAASVNAAAPYDPHSSGPSAGYDDSFTKEELRAAAEFGHRVASEKVFVLERLAMLKDEQQNLLDVLDVLKEKGHAYVAKQLQQNSGLDYILDQIRNATHSLVDLEDLLAVQESKVEIETGINGRLSVAIHEQKQSVIDQASGIDKLEVLIDEVAEKLAEKVSSRKENANNEVSEVGNNTDSLIDVLNTQKCTTGMVYFDIDPEVAEGTGVFYFDGLFGADIPIVYCAAQGLHTNIKLSTKTERPTFDPYTGSYKVTVPEPFENLAFSLDCKAFNDRAVIKAFDQSRGYYNSVHTIYVRVKACSFGPQDGPLGY